MKPDSHSIGLQREPGMDVLEAARRAVYEYVDPKDANCRGVPAVAKKMGVLPGTLYNKLNFDNVELRHTLSVPDLVQILNITGDVRVLSALCHTFGLVCFPVPDFANVSDAALLELVNNIGAEGGDFHRALNSILTAKRCRASHIGILHKEGFEFIGAIVEAMARTKGLVDAE